MERYCRTRESIQCFGCAFPLKCVLSCIRLSTLVTAPDPVAITETTSPAQVLERLNSELPGSEVVKVEKQHLVKMDSSTSSS